MPHHCIGAKRFKDLRIKRNRVSRVIGGTQREVELCRIGEVANLGQRGESRDKGGEIRAVMHHHR